MERQTDEKVAVVLAEQAKQRFGNLLGYSFDKDFYTPDN